MTKFEGVQNDQMGHSLYNTKEKQANNHVHNNPFTNIDA